MVRRTLIKSSIYTLLAVIFTAIIFYIDIVHPIDVVFSLLYTIPILFTFKYENKKLTIYIAILASILTVADLYFTPEKNEFSQILINKGLSLFLIWAISLSFLYYLKLISKINNQNTELLKSLQISDDIKNALDKSALVSITDVKGRIIFINNVFCQVSKYSKEELIGQNHRMINSGFHSKDFFIDLYSTIHNGKTWKGVIKNKAKDGSCYWVSSTITPQFDIINKITGFISIRFDITKEKELKNEIRLQNEVLDSKNRELLKTNYEILKIENALEEAQKIAKIGHWKLDLRSENLTWSNQIYSIFRLNPDEFTPSYDKFLNLVHPDDRDLVDKAYSNSLITRKPYEITHRLQFSDGDIAYVTEKCETTFDSNGQPLASIGTVQDITSQYKSDLDLKHSESRLRNITISENLGVFDWDIVNDKIYFSDIWKSQIGYTDDELENHPSAWLDNVHPVDKEEVINAFHSFFADKEKSNFETIHRLRHKNGSYRWIKSRSEAVSDTEGNVIRLFGVHTDITEQKISQYKIEESEKRYRNLFENSLVGMITTSIKDKKVLAANNTALSMFEYESLDELKNSTTTSHYVNIEDQKIVFESLTNYEKITNFEAEFITNKGNKIWLQTSARIDVEKQVVEGAFIDVTQRKKLEKEILSSLGEKEILLSEVHHRVKNNLQIVTGLITMQIKKIDDENLKNELVEIKTRIKSIALVHEKLYQSENLSAIDLKTYFTSLVAEVSNSFNNIIDVKTEFSSTEIKIDKAIPFGLILNEILTNIFKHAFVNKINADNRIIIKLFNNNSTIEMSISDNGVGFDKNSKTNIKSIGFKLIEALSKQLDLTYNIESKIGKGTTYNLKLLLNE